MCLRTVLGGRPNPKLPVSEVRLSDAKLMFDANFVGQLKRMFMCGNYGDPIAARDTLEIFKYFRELNPKIHLSMFTNGGVRPAQWWQDLSKVVDHCRFAIDGLEDTNATYRKNTDWNRIIENATAFIDAGGHAEWDFIIFEHNEYQVEEARSLAKKLGFQKFRTKKTGRFFSNSRSKVKDAQEVHNKQGEVDYFIRMPKNPDHQNNALKKERLLAAKYGSLEKYLDKTPVQCKVAIEKSLYVSAEGLVFPCCWTANQLYPWYFEAESSPVWKMIKDRFDSLDQICAKHNSIQDIVESSWFQHDFKDRWERESIDAGKLKVCAKVCGSEFDPFREQFR